MPSINLLTHITGSHLSGKQKVKAHGPRNDLDTTWFHTLKINPTREANDKTPRSGNTFLEHIIYDCRLSKSNFDISTRS